MVVAAAIIAAAGAVAQEEPLEPILGIQLGAGLDQFPLCPNNGKSTTWCRRSASPSTAVRAPEEGDLPSWVKIDREYPDLYRILSGGKIVEFRLNTRGPQVQYIVIEAITGRFGKPALYEVRTKQNSFGAMTQSALVLWDTPKVGILHDCSKLDECTLVFQRGEDFRRWIEEQKKQRQRDKKL